MSFLTAGLALGGAGLGAWSAGQQAEARAEAIEEQNRIARENLRRQKRYREEALGIIQEPTQQEQRFHQMAPQIRDRYQHAARDLERSNVIPDIEDARRQMGETARGEYLMAEDNPYLQDHIEAAQRPIQRQYEEQIVPQVSSRAMQQGAYGGSREGIAQAQAARDHQRELADISTQMAGQNYENERQWQLQAQQSIPQAAIQEAEARQAIPQMHEQGFNVMGQSADMAAQRDQQHANIAAQMQPQREITDQYKPPEGAAMAQGALQGATSMAAMGGGFGSGGFGSDGQALSGTSPETGQSIADRDWSPDRGRAHQEWMQTQNMRQGQVQQIGASPGGIQ